MKKILSVALSTAMAFSMFASVAFGQAGLTDVNAQYNYLKDKGIFNGYPDGQAHLDRSMTRAEFAKVITKTLGLKEVTGVYSYNDKNYGANHWAAPYVEAVTAEGIMEGQNTTKKLFGLTSNVTVQEMATVLVRALHLEIPTETNNTASAWAKGYVQAAINAGLVKADANFQSNASRELLVGAAYAVDQKVAVSVKSYTVSENGKVVEFTMNDGKTVKVTLDKALEANKETEVKFTYNGKEFTHKVTYVVTAAAVESVSAINSSQLEVKFNKQVDEASVIEAGKLKDGVFTFTNLPGATAVVAKNAKGELSNDGKTLTITVGALGTEKFEGRYDIVIDGVKDVDGNSFEKYDVKNVEFAKDTVAPQVTGYKQVSADDVEINFSEPIDEGAIFEFKNDKGEAIAEGSSKGQIEKVTYSKGAQSVTVKLANIEAGKKVTVTIKNVKDLAGNLITPQPSTIVIEKNELGTFAPTISSVTQTGAKTFVIKFSEALDGKLAAGDVTLDPSNTATNIKKVTDSEYELTVTNPLNGLTTVKVDKTKIKNKYGQAAGTSGTLDKLVVFKEDTVAPTATVKLASDKNNKQVLELTFDKDVVLAGSAVVTLAGTQVKDYVTTTVGSVDATAVYADGKGNNKKVVHIPLSGAGLNVEGAVYHLTIANKATTTNGIVSDAGVAMKSVSADFTRGKDGDAPTQQNTEKVNVSTVVKTDNDTVEVTFSKDIDPASATNVNNYKIADAVIETATVNASAPTKVVLKLKKGSVTDSYVRTVTIENVKAKNSSVAMDKYTGTVNLTENVRPTIEKAEVTAPNVITLTFSEAVKDGGDLNKDSFVVKAGTNVVAQHNDGATRDANNNKKVNIKLNANLSSLELAQTITVESTSTVENFKVVDLNGNKAETFAPITVVKP